MGQKYEDIKQPKEMYRLTEVTKILGISDYRVYELIKAGKLPYIRFGRKGDGNGGEFRIILTNEAIRKYSANRLDNDLWEFGKKLNVPLQNQNDNEDENDK